MFLFPSQFFIGNTVSDLALEERIFEVVFSIANFVRIFKFGMVMERGKTDWIAADVLRSCPMPRGSWNYRESERENRASHALREKDTFRAPASWYLGSPREL